MPEPAQERVAAAPPDSLPGVSRAITAVALDGHVDLARVPAAPGWQELRRYPYGRSYALEGGATLFLFNFGAAVIDGVEGLPDHLEQGIADALELRTLPETQETWFIEVDPARAHLPRVLWDRVVIPGRRVELVAAVALLLAQSVALERYELAADAVLDQTLALSRELAAGGRLPRRTRGLIERLGRLTGDRLELARWFFLITRPEETWQDRSVAHLYNALFANLELRQRHDAMLHKLGAAERATQAVLGMWHGRRSNALEWAIVILIVVEIVFGVWGLL